MLPPVPKLSDYGIDPKHGFLPSELPLTRLPDYYSRWENIIENLQSLVLSGRLWDTIKHMPTLSTDHLHTAPEWRRAYVLLVLMLHAYIWSGDKPQQRIPPPLSIPLLKVSEHLELPPVATYAALCLWNYRPIFPDEPADKLENLATLCTLTGSMDEQWFYLISVAIESRGASTLPLMLKAISAARAGDSQQVMDCLTDFAQIVDDINVLLQRMYRHCDPHMFYHRIRPLLAGSMNMEEAGLPNGVLLDEGTGKEEWKRYRGGSNAQSSLIQFFDIVLGVEHRPTGEPRSSVPPSQDGLTGRRRWHGFMMEMRDYMPGPHRRFLEHTASVANIREYVEQHQSDKALTTAFNAAVAMVKALRTTHITMVSRYIILKSREKSSGTRPLAAGAPALNLATVSTEGKGAGSKKLRGTGGTALIPFLKQARDETGEAAIGSWGKQVLDSKRPEVTKVIELPKVGETIEGRMEILGLAGTWSMEETEGGLCHW
ncbi:tryptophan 2,3- dioxygenase [Emydomyces testavorans]|uniref:Indoleamine 2,3-dioxygenase n=1 Tax=Emydomyces testavorans TaxID=2070801 RepID=A0AAF0IKZ8_9EURO|nr:tryptophan 2,3- dioxygenase [Emydomyces testavorans]